MIKTILKLASVAIFAFSTAVSAMDLPHQGEVLETVNSGGYTYVKINEAGEDVWAAGPQMEVKKGDVVRFSEQMRMPSFTSKTLDRTFAPLIFAGDFSIRK
ncbi:NrfJ [Ferrimonas lipolytica]|uniref:NrfJ n=1 Tax=Ferrimonas lipolytica TaxID=2724191 RepID=A0A6H1UG44_9GAMM|nr:NrfJ [Ferrimonas lipolytica]QIZ77293.1 NrfJ [Ferrimonas lipolytica]